MPNDNTQSNRLFYIRADDAGGFNQDLLVIAGFPSIAKDFWRKHYELEATDEPEWIRAVPGVTSTREPGPITWSEINPD